MIQKTGRTQSLVARAGLGALARKLKGAGRCTIAYLGGSITWGGNASDIARFSFRARTTRWLRERFSGCAIDEIDAGIGGTGSDLAVFRMHDDVLRFKPDLIFIEFAVNDTGKTSDFATSTIEGIVRQALRAEPRPSLCFVYTLSQVHMSAIEAGLLPPSVLWQERIADHYGIPSINVGLPVARKVLDKELDWALFAGDPVHPTDFGHELYAATIAEGLQELFRAPEPAETSPELPAPLSAKPWDTTHTIGMPAAPGAFSGWSYRALQKRGGWDCFDGVLESNIAGSEAAFDFSGTVVGLYYLLGPESGDLLFSVDDSPFQSVRVFDDWSLDVWRPHYCLLKSDLTPGPHRLRIRVSGQHDPRATGVWVKLAYVLYMD